MSQLLIQQYLNQLSTLKKVSGSLRESVLREAFKDLLKSWGKSHDLVFIPEYKLDTATKETRFVDGALLYELRVPFGYWEAKDTKDDLDEEIAKKFKRGYPQDNIIFDDTVTAVLIQNKQEVMRAAVEDTDELKKLLECFFRYERREISQFKQAVTQFKSDLPAVLEALRAMIETAHQGNKKFRQESERFLVHAQEAINPSLTAADVREMLIQHVLTEEIFSTVFPNASFHRENNIARELYKLEGTFFTGNTKFQTLKALEPYYAAIRAAAAQIERHNEKQAFLKALYENFYKVYNVKAADRLGVVYTPNEIVRFMIESADWLTQKHFGKALIDKDVEILDPATGTGTFICELLEHFRGQPKKLEYKYANELHANEVAILPYYVANLNIEATFAALTGKYQEFENLCFVDTLDNVGMHTSAHGTTADLFGSVSEENVARIKRQNSKRISVIIGNPPYNANQLNEMDNNKNREYPAIDARIKQTYIAESTAQKTKLYDMYARFFRWASDRLAENGVLVFITNRSYIDSRTFDGFRKCVQKEFSETYIVDLGGDVRANPKLSGTKHNVFGIQTGVAICFLVKKKGASACRFFYSDRPQMESAEDKLAFLAANQLRTLTSVELRPDGKHNWINLTQNDFEDLIPLASKAAKAATRPSQKKAIFQDFGFGVSTNRDEWVYDDSKSTLAAKMQFFESRYMKQPKGAELDTAIKWSRNLRRRHEQGREEAFAKKRITRATYRPFCTKWLYDSALFVDEQGIRESIPAGPNPALQIIVTDPTGQKPWLACAVDGIADLHFVGAAAGAVCLPRIRDVGGRLEENITEWALALFREHYGARVVTRESIFEYVYAVLHDPAYREKYAQNLKRELPRVPLYADFDKWAAMGRELISLHVGFERVSPFPMKRQDSQVSKLPPKAFLKSDPRTGTIRLDEITTLSDIPNEAWKYMLGNRSAIDWVLDQYKETKPKDPTIREKFNTYRFADYKEQVIDLLARVTTVSVETVRITEAMKKAPR